MRCKLSKLVCASIFYGLWLLSPAIVQAQDADYGREGPYVGGGFTYAIEQFDLDDLEDDTGLNFDPSDGLGIDARGGYRLHPYFALEGNLQVYGVDLDTRGSFDADADLVGGNLAVNFKAFALTGRVQPYGVFGLGVGVVGIEFDDDDFDDDFDDHDDDEYDASFLLRAGAGVDVYITPKIVVFVEATYDYLTSDIHLGGGPGFGANVIPITTGVVYRF